MNKKEQLEKALHELKVLTGISFQVESDEEEVLDAAIGQIMQLTSAYKEKYNKSSFIQNLLMDNILHVDMYNRAKKFRIDIDVRRMVFIIETEGEEDAAALEIIRHLFRSQNGDYVITVDTHNIVLVKQIEDNADEESIRDIAEMIVDMVNAEAMSKVRVSYGNISEKLDDLSRSYKEARMALEVGRIFYSEQTIIPYGKLGIGRLIYQLPIPLCKMYLKEVFGDRLPDTFDEETLTTINIFFDNNLNISETARQLYVHRNTLVYRLEKLQKQTGLDIRVFDDALTFKIAIMVAGYMKFMKEDIE